MKAYRLDHNALLGSVIAQDMDQQIVHLNLQKDNEVPEYETDAIITFVVLSGQARIQTDENYVDIQQFEVVRVEPNEKHTVSALVDGTVLLAIKQLCHTRNVSKQLRFGQCCL